MAKKTKNRGSAGQRSKKKHEKELKRKHKLMSPAPLRPALAGAAAWKPETEGISGYADRLRARYYPLACDIAEHTPSPLDELPGMVWQKPRIAALSTTDLLARLGAVGITTSEEAFIAATAADFSAIRFAQTAWLPLLSPTASVHDRDLALLGACSLWERLRPTPVSLEALGDAFRDGVEHALSTKFDLAVEAWLVFFDRLRSRFTPAIRTLPDLDRLLDGEVDDIEAWTDDLVDLTGSAHPRQDDLTRRVVAALGALAEQLDHAHPSWLAVIRDHQAHLLAGLGAGDEAVALLRAEIARDPGNLAPYVALTEVLMDDAADFREGVLAAIAVLEEARAEAALKADHSEINDRIAGLKLHLDDEGEDEGSP
jgi:hypothetical protein